MISIIITAFKEPETIKRSIISFAEQNYLKNNKHEIIVVAPDKETINSASELKKKYKNLLIFRDSGGGKPSAMNFIFKKAKGKVLIFSDGDVYVSNNSVENLVKHLEDEKIGAVSGRPISINPVDQKYGYWAYVLTEIANERRKYAVQKGFRFFCSGYLFAIRRELFPKLNEELLSEDGFISNEVYKAGKRISYSEKSEVFVKYPDNFKDWIKQKRRSAGGYNQIRMLSGIKIRSFGSESKGIFGFFKYIRSLKEFIWIVLLIFSRIYLWGNIYFSVNIKKKRREELWKRVDSTK
jgi:cellulose synthase/poly-beta-1,6-N-acetylglucosamine synthase-like glycosyltransferase